MKNQVINNLDKEFIVYKSDMIEAINAYADKIIAKSDREMKELRGEIRADMQELRSELKADIKELRGEINKMYYVIFTMFASIIVGIVLQILKG